MLMFRAVYLSPLILCCGEILLSGCELPKGAGARDVNALRMANRVSIVRYAEINFSFDGIGEKLDVGMIAAGISPTPVDDSNRELSSNIFKKFELPDPGKLIEETLRKDLREMGGLENLATEEHVLSIKDAAKVGGSFFGANYKIEIKPVEFSISEHVIRKPRFEVLLIGRAKLISVSDKRTVWSGLCSYFERDDKRLLFDDEPLANNAAILRKVIPIAAEGCAKKLGISLLGK